MSERETPNGAQRYRGNGNHDWEDVTVWCNTQRLRVPGGWLYIHYLGGPTMAFVPVPEVVGYPV